MRPARYFSIIQLSNSRDLCGTEIAITVKPWYNDCTLCNPKRRIRFALLRRDSAGTYGLERKYRCAALPFLRS